MVAALDKDGEDLPKRTLWKDFSNKCMADFVTQNARPFFLKLKMDQIFHTEDPGSWNDQPGYYLMTRKLAQGIQVTNDTAEWGWHSFKNTCTAGL